MNATATSGERPAPLLLLPSSGAGSAQGAAPFGSYQAVLETGRTLLAGELSQRLARLGAAVAPLEAPAERTAGDPVDGGRGSGAPEPAGFGWGAWVADAARQALRRAGEAGRSLDAIGYAGAGALALAGDAALDELLSPLPGEVVANNRFSADAFVFAATAGAATGPGGPDSGAPGPDLRRGLERLALCPADNTAVRCLESVGFRARDLGDHAWSRFDVDTPLDLALLRTAAALPETRRIDPAVSAFLEMVRLPGGRSLSVPGLAEIGAVLRDRAAQLVVAGRVPGALVRLLETETACRVRWFIEERGMRSARDARPRSLLARWIEERGAGSLVTELAALGDALILDTRVLMAALAGTPEADRWPAAEERYAADFGDIARVRTPWLRELAEAASGAGVPVLTGGHTLVSDGLRILVAAAWERS